MAPYRIPWATETFGLSAYGTLNTNPFYAQVLEFFSVCIVLVVCVRI